MEFTPGTRPAFRRTAVGVVLLSILLAGCILRYGIVNPSQNYQLDFRAFYATGRALHMGINPYDLAAKQALVNPQLPGKQHLMGYANPPPTLPLVYLVALLPLPIAQLAWANFQLLLLILGMLLVFAAVRAEYGSPVSLLTAVAYWLSYPVHSLFRWGQMDGLCVVFIALAVYFLSRRHRVSAGVAVGIAAVAKVYPVAYLWVFLLRREWRSLLAGCATIGVLMTVSLATLTPEARRRYLSNNKDEFSQVDWVISPQNMSIIGFMHRALVNNERGTEASLPWLDAGPAAARGASIAGIVLLIAITSWRTVRSAQRVSVAEALAAFVPVVLLAELNAWPHHCVPMLVPLALLAGLAGAVPQLGLGDGLWVGIVIFLYTFCPVHQFDVHLQKQLEHVVGPTTSYALVLTWLFMLIRYPALRRRCENPSRSEGDGRAGVRSPSFRCSPCPLPVREGGNVRRSQRHAGAGTT